MRNIDYKKLWNALNLRLSRLGYGKIYWEYCWPTGGFWLKTLPKGSPDIPGNSKKLYTVNQKLQICDCDPIIYPFDMFPTYEKVIKMLLEHSKARGIIVG